MSNRSTRLLGALIAVDALGALVAARHRVAGEPFGLGRSIDVSRPAVLFFWGSGLSAPIAALIGSAVLARRRPSALRPLGAVSAFGGMAEPVFWGRRPCPRYARLLLGVHAALGAALALTPDDG